MEKLNDKYNPKDFEDAIYDKWLKKEYFKPSKDKNKKPYTIVMPPPNITGKLHMGHALDETLQDILIRYKRMDGYDTLWVPGTDHASIATEVKIVDKLKKEGKTKHDLGRDEFLKQAWEWKKEYGGTITSQLRKLGCSCDWSKERFTLDDGLSKAVHKVFIDYYNKGLIYKGKRMINWCPGCNSSISDAEVEYEEEDTKLWHICYKTPDGKSGVVIATTRPETMLGDVAVAVHPDDERYKNLIGKTVVLPIMNKEIPIIADAFVEKEFGTGCVKITPAHDMNDYEAGLRHGLDIIEVFDENWKMGSLCKKYEGMNLLEAREKIVEDLEKIGALVKIEDYKHNAGTCYRCHNKIEPKISEQWFVKMEDLAKPAIEAVKSGKIRFIPQKYEKTYFNWMENTRDWCISRQLWWGHRIPAYYCQDCGNTMVLEEEPHICTKCNSTNILQDEDTLDTWFSSALWPFSTLGWPDNTEELQKHYPTDTLITGYDIITFWVSRMIVAGLENVKDIPFKDVLIHGIVRDSQGRKMSKSLGNGIDPLEVIEQYSTDALRFSLVLNTTPGNDIRYMPEKLDAASNFANKIWNASRFVLMNMEGINITGNIDEEKLSIEDKWILSKLNILVKEARINLDNYDTGVLLQKIYDFIWNEFCDWYIEMVKPRLYSENIKTKEIALEVLNYVLMTSLKLLHPFMPFVTEEIYTKLPNSEETIMLSKWPEYNEKYHFVNEQKQIEEMKELITNIRNIRTNMNVHPSRKSKLIFIASGLDKLIKECTPFLQKLGFAEEITVQQDKKNIPANAISIVIGDFEVMIPFEDLVDIEAEKIRLQEELKKLQAEVQRGEKMLSNQGFISKAPQAKIDEEKAKLEKYKQMLATTENRLKELQ